MECGAKVVYDDLETGKRKHTSSPYLTFVALDENRRPVEVPEVIPETDEEKRRWEAAEVRPMFRMKQKALLNKS